MDTQGYAWIRMDTIPTVNELPEQLPHPTVNAFPEQLPHPTVNEFPEQLPHPTVNGFPEQGCGPPETSKCEKGAFKIRPPFSPMWYPPGVKSGHQLARLSGATFSQPRTRGSERAAGTIVPER